MERKLFSSVEAERREEEKGLITSDKLNIIEEKLEEIPMTPKSDLEHLKTG